MLWITLEMDGRLRYASSVGKTGVGVEVEVEFGGKRDWMAAA